MFKVLKWKGNNNDAFLEASSFLSHFFTSFLSKWGGMTAGAGLI